MKKDDLPVQYATGTENEGDRDDLVVPIGMTILLCCVFAMGFMLGKVIG